MTEPRADYYAVLGISPQASAVEIARAYRRLLRRVHPDTRTTDADPAEAGEALALLREAFAVLGDPTRRAAYDQHTRPRPRPGPPHPAPPRGSERGGSYLAGPPDPPLRAGPVRYRPSPRPGGDR